MNDRVRELAERFDPVVGSPELCDLLGNRFSTVRVARTLVRRARRHGLL